MNAAAIKLEHIAIGVFWLGNVFFCCSTLLRLGFVQPYIRRNGMKPECRFFNWSVILDYHKARRIAGDHGRVPRFLRAFEIVTASALLLGIGFIVWVMVIEM